MKKSKDRNKIIIKVFKENNIEMGQPFPIIIPKQKS